MALSPLLKSGSRITIKKPELDVSNSGFWKPKAW